MKIFNLGSHTSCYNYAKCVKEGFTYYRVNAGESYREEARRNCILFVLTGSLHLRCNEFDFMLEAQHMTFIHRGCLCDFSVCGTCNILVAQFESFSWTCEKAVFSTLACLKGRVEYHMTSYRIKEPLRMFLELEAVYLQDGANCVHFHEITLKELFWVLNFYYTKIELANLFYMVIGNNNEFKNKVLEHYGSAKSVKELASFCTLSLSAFKRQFLAEFGEPASQWMQKQMIGKIKYKLSDVETPLGTIAYELNFSSLSQFSKYCTRYLGCPPGEYRRQLIHKRNDSL